MHISQLLNVRNPRRVEFFDDMRVRAVSCGACWSAVLTAEGGLYTFGYGDGGWLGLQPPADLQQVEVDSLTPAQAAVLGEHQQEIRCFDSRHSALAPRCVTLLCDLYAVREVRAGAGHMITMCEPRTNADTPLSGKGIAATTTSSSSSSSRAGAKGNGSSGSSGSNSGGSSGSAFTGGGYSGVDTTAYSKDAGNSTAGGGSFRISNNSNNTNSSGSGSAKGGGGGGGVAVSSKYDAKSTTSAGAAGESTSQLKLAAGGTIGTRWSNSNASNYTSSGGDTTPLSQSMTQSLSISTTTATPASVSLSNTQELQQNLSSILGNAQQLQQSSPNAQLFSWVRHKKVAELSSYLSGGGSVHAQDGAGNTPLIVACQNGHMAVCRLLVSNGAELNARNYKGNTALHYAFNYGYDDIGAFLVHCGADDLQTNGEGLTCYEGLTHSDLDLL